MERKTEGMDREGEGGAASKALVQESRRQECI